MRLGVDIYEFILNSLILFKSLFKIINRLLWGVFNIFVIKVYWFVVLFWLGSVMVVWMCIRLEICC